MLNLFDRFIAENTTNSKSFGVRSGNSSNVVGKLEEEINRKRKAANLEVTIRKCEGLLIVIIINPCSVGGSYQN